jgi:SOS regulatory protein LexA
MPRQRDLKPIITKLSQFWRSRKRLPTFVECLDLWGYKSTQAVARTIQALIEVDVLRRDDAGKLVPGRRIASLPILGSVQAGFPTPAEEERLGEVSFDDLLVRNPQSTYVVKVSGDSMSGAGIQPGDMVVVERGVQPRMGDIVVAQVDGDWTMKRYERRGNRVVLVPANPKYKLIVPQHELVLGGVVRGVVRVYG